MKSKTEIQQQALANAVNQQSTMNYAAISDGFTAMGVAEEDIQPRQNVFSFHAWKALGRSVKKGEHGVRVVTFVTCVKKDKKTGEVSSFRKPHGTTVFHVSQTKTSTTGHAVTNPITESFAAFCDNVPVDAPSVQELYDALTGTEILTGQDAVSMFGGAA